VGYQIHIHYNIHLYESTHTYIYMHMHIHIHMYIIYIYINLYVHMTHVPLRMVVIGGRRCGAPLQDIQSEAHTPTYEYI
jgi:hypothetical protein